MKRMVMTSFIIVLGLLLSPINSYADIKVHVNGSPLKFQVAPKIEKGRTLVPLRATFEALGAKVVWDEQTHIINIENKGVDALENKQSELTTEETTYIYSLISYFATVDSTNMEFTHAMFPREETNSAETLLKYESALVVTFSECEPPAPPTERFKLIYNDLKESRDIVDKLHSLVLETQKAGNTETLLFFAGKEKSESRQQLETLWEQALVELEKASMGVYELMQIHGYNFFPQ